MTRIRALLIAFISPIALSLLLVFNMQVENVFPQPLGLFTIELGVKNIPLNVFVQRKEAEDAEALYQEILTAMGSQEPNKILELKSEDKTQRKVAVRVSEISAVQISQKDKL